MKKIYLVLIVSLAIISCKQQYENLHLRSACYEKYDCNHSVQNCLDYKLQLQLLFQNSNQTYEEGSDLANLEIESKNTDSCLTAKENCRSECDKKYKN